MHVQHRALRRSWWIQLLGALPAGGRDSAGLEPLLQFVTKHLTDPRYSSMLTAVAHTILNLYAIAVSSPVQPPVEN